jgi:CRISPR/Cas system-associated endonuclease Cas1
MTPHTQVSPSPQLLKQIETTTDREAKLEVTRRLLAADRARATATLLQLSYNLSRSTSTIKIS